MLVYEGFSSLKIDHLVHFYLETLESTVFCRILLFPGEWEQLQLIERAMIHLLCPSLHCAALTVPSLPLTPTFSLFWNNLMKLKETGLLWSHIPVTIHSLWSTDVVLFTLFKELVQNTLCSQTLLSYEDLGFVLMIPLLQLFVIFPWKCLFSLLLLLERKIQAFMSSGF